MRTNSWRSGPDEKLPQNRPLLGSLGKRAMSEGSKIGVFDPSVSNQLNTVITAEKAMKSVYPKPKFDDVRWRLVYPLHYLESVEKYKGAQARFIILSIIREESHFNSEIVSPVGAVGLMQLMPATANEIASAYGISNDLYNPESNIRLGSLFYSQMKSKLWNNDIYAVCAYNGGGGSVTNWVNTLKYEDLDDFIEKIPYPETQSYVKKVLRSYWCYSNIY